MKLFWDNDAKGMIPGEEKKMWLKNKTKKHADYEDHVQTHARKACRLEHKLTSTLTVHPDKYACIHPKTKRPDQKQTQRHSNMRFSLCVKLCYKLKYVTRQLIHDPSLLLTKRGYSQMGIFTV